MKEIQGRISVNRNNSDLWKEDTRKSVEMYNDWFLNFAPKTYANERRRAICSVGGVLKTTNFLQITCEQLKDNPEIISTLRLSTSPPLSRARLAGISGVKLTLINSMEEGKSPKYSSSKILDESLSKIVFVVNKLLDRDLFLWLGEKRNPSPLELKIAECVLADRLCGSSSDPIIRNEQEKRQFRAISDYLNSLGYAQVNSRDVPELSDLPVGTFCFHKNVPVKIDQQHDVIIPIDVVIKRKNASSTKLPLLIECKSAGDFTNTNKRRKEEAQKIAQLRNVYGRNVDFVLFLCGYFDGGYLGYEAAEGIDWIWEHRIEDFKKAGV